MGGGGGAGGWEGGKEGKRALLPLSFLLVPVVCTFDCTVVHSTILGLRVKKGGRDLRCRHGNDEKPFSFRFSTPVKGEGGRKSSQ